MAHISVSVKGVDKLEKKLQKMNSVRFDAVVQLQANEMVDRATASHNPSLGGTPYSTEETRPGGPHGELLESVNMYGKGQDAEVGYREEYAPHVEFGHRTKDGGWVPGQHFLQNNADIQRPIYREDLIKAIRKG